MYLSFLNIDTCRNIAQKLSGFNGCSVPDWMPIELVNTHGKDMEDSLWKYWWSSEKPSGENYPQIFETDCNKHDICYGCVSLYSYELQEIQIFYFKTLMSILPY